MSKPKNRPFIPLALDDQLYPFPPTVIKSPEWLLFPASRKPGAGRISDCFKKKVASRPKKPRIFVTKIG